MPTLTMSVYVVFIVFLIFHFDIIVNNIKQRDRTYAILYCTACHPYAMPCHAMPCRPHAAPSAHARPRPLPRLSRAPARKDNGCLVTAETHRTHFLIVHVIIIGECAEHCGASVSEAVWWAYTYLPSIPGFPGLSRVSASPPGIPELVLSIPGIGD